MYPATLLDEVFMYRCQICQTISEPGHKQLKCIQSRRRGQTEHFEIAFEIPTCINCYRLVVDHKMDLDVLMKCHGKVLKIPVGPAKRVLTEKVGKPKIKSRQHFCDICNEPVDDGQVTSDTILCKKHANIGRSGIDHK